MYICIYIYVYVCVCIYIYIYIAASRGPLQIVRASSQTAVCPSPPSNVSLHKTVNTRLFVDRTMTSVVLCKRRRLHVECHQFRMQQRACSSIFSKPYESNTGRISRQTGAHRHFKPLLFRLHVVSCRNNACYQG